ALPVRLRLRNFCGPAGNETAHACPSQHLRPPARLLILESERISQGRLGAINGATGVPARRGHCFVHVIHKSYHPNRLDHSRGRRRPQSAEPAEGQTPSSTRTSEARLSLASI